MWAFVKQEVAVERTSLSFTYHAAGLRVIIRIFWCGMRSVPISGETYAITGIR